jgi:hypothetical protein
MAEQIAIKFHDFPRVDLQGFLLVLRDSGTFRGRRKSDRFNAYARQKVAASLWGKAGRTRSGLGRGGVGM